MSGYLRTLDHVESKSVEKTNRQTVKWSNSMVCSSLVNIEMFTNVLFVIIKKKNVKNETKGSQPAFTCSKLTIETLEQGVKYA